MLRHFRAAKLQISLFLLSLCLCPPFLCSYTRTCSEINKNMHPDGRAKRARSSAEEKTVPSHKPLFVWENASLPKLDHSVFDGTRCTSIKEIEGLTGSQIKALNPSICLFFFSAQSGAREGSEWERDYRGEIFREGNRQVVGSGRRGKQTTVAPWDRDEGDEMVEEQVSGSSREGKMEVE